MNGVGSRENERRLRCDFDNTFKFIVKRQRNGAIAFCLSFPEHVSFQSHIIPPRNYVPLILLLKSMLVLSVQLIACIFCKFSDSPIKKGSFHLQPAIVHTVDTNYTGFMIYCLSAVVDLFYYLH